jgi:MOSC domain-containing protein YiiM
MQLLSINTSLAKDVQFQGRNISTGIFKEPVSGPVRVRKLGLEGDQQADLNVHGGVDKAVYLYPSEHFAFWQDQYPERNFTPGLFGENLTSTGLLETNIQVGDILGIGSAEFMVTIPRMPCYKLGIKMGDPGIIKAFLQANRSGFYLKVLTEGIIEAGQPIVKTGSDGYGLNIEEVARLYALDKDDQQLLEKALKAPNLTTDWKDYFAKRLE